MEFVNDIDIEMECCGVWKDFPAKIKFDGEYVIIETDEFTIRILGDEIEGII